MVPLHYALKSGDVVEILTQKNKKPSADWLEFVKSIHARKKIASFLNKEQEALVFQRKRGDNAEIRITARDRAGLLRDVSNTFARHNINIKKAVTDSKNQTLIPIIIQAQFKNRADLEKVMARIKQIKSVEDVRSRLLPK